MTPKRMKARHDRDKQIKNRQKCVIADESPLQSCYWTDGGQWERKDEKRTRTMSNKEISDFREGWEAIYKLLGTWIYELWRALE